MNLLRKVFIIIIGVATVHLFAQPVQAIEIGKGLDLSGAIRWRMELDNKDFHNNDPMVETQVLRTRINLDVTSIEKARVFIQIQDSRDLGYTTTGMNNDTNLGIHQAYLILNNGTANGLSMQVGRFEASYGRERLIGAVGWSNIGRSFDGIRASYKKDKNFVDIFWMKMLDRTYDYYSVNRDAHFLGLYAGMLDGILQGYLLYDWDLARTQRHYSLARYTLGLYYHNIYRNFTLDFDAAYQGGEQAQYDISAYMLAGEAMAQLNDGKTSLGLGFDYTSGDDNSSDTKIKYFDNLYYTGHKFRGYMDYFTGSTSYGLLDIYLKAVIQASPRFTFSADLHNFQTAVDFTQNSKYLGSELDVTGKLAFHKQLSFQSGLSVFFASDDWVPDGDAATWLYLMLNAEF